jgi:hypothetical protein
MLLDRVEYAGALTKTMASAQVGMTQNRFRPRPSPRPAALSTFVRDLI